MAALLRSVVSLVGIAETPAFGWVIVTILGVLGAWGLIGFMQSFNQDKENVDDRTNEPEGDYGGDDFGIFGGDDSGAGDFDKRP